MSQKELLELIKILEPGISVVFWETVLGQSAQMEEYRALSSDCYKHGDKENGRLYWEFAEKYRLLVCESTSRILNALYKAIPYLPAKLAGQFPETSFPFYHKGDPKKYASTIREVVAYLVKKLKRLQALEAKGQSEAQQAPASMPQASAPEGKSSEAEVAEAQPTAKAHHGTKVSREQVFAIYANSNPEILQQVFQSIESNQPLDWKLAEWDRILPIPDTTTARELANSLGVTHVAVLKTDWWKRRQKRLQDEKIQQGYRYSEASERTTPEDFQCSEEEN